MGNQPCSNCQENKIESPAYGHFDILTDNNTQYAIINKSIPKETIQAYKLDEQLTKRRKIESVYVVKLYAYKITLQNYFTNIELKYQYIPETLADKYSKWRSTDKVISQSQIGNILSGVQGALLDLNRAGITHRFVNLSTILCIKSMYKLMDTSMVTFLTGLDLARAGDQNQFLSQKNINILNYKGIRPEYTLQDDLFSLGLVIIVIVLKCWPKDIYIEGLLGVVRLNAQLIEKGMKILDRQYNSWIGRKVRELLFGLGKESMLDTTIKDPYLSYD